MVLRLNTLEWNLSRVQALGKKIVYKELNFKYIYSMTRVLKGYFATAQNRRRLR